MSPTKKKKTTLIIWTIVTACDRFLVNLLQRDCLRKQAVWKQSIMLNADNTMLFADGSGLPSLILVHFKNFAKSIQTTTRVLLVLFRGWQITVLGTYYEGERLQSKATRSGFHLRVQPPRHWRVGHKSFKFRSYAVECHAAVKDLRFFATAQKSTLLRPQLRKSRSFNLKIELSPSG